MKHLARSPSQTVEWLTCPVKRWLNYSLGVKPRRLSKGDIAAIAGRGFAKGMEVWNQTQDKDAAVKAAQTEVVKNKEEIVSQGRVVPDWDLAYFVAVDSRVEKAVSKYMDDDPLPQHGLSIEDVELSLPEHGNARIDVGARDVAGNLVVIDYKYKARLVAEYRQKELDRYQNSWQQYHYAWGYGDLKKEVVASYYICLVVGEPKFSATLHEYPVHPESLEAWKVSAERVWTQMEWEDRGISSPWMVAVHEDRFGPCPYQAACFTHRWDMPLMMQRDYVVGKDE